MKRIAVWREQGIPLGKLNFFMAAVVVVISALLFISTSTTGVQYEDLRISTETLIDLQDRAYELQNASDYLTEQARYFAVTGERTYLERYFQEAKVSCRRERALDALRSQLDGSPACQELEAALEKSNALMEREYYSMRLTVAANNYDLTQFPEEIQAVPLSALDLTLSNGALQERARRLVFDEEYQSQKDAISQSLQQCLHSLVEQTQQAHTQSAQLFQEQLSRQKALIFLLIILVLFIVLFTSRLIISPLVQAVLEIREERPIPPHGSYEFRFLARTYNLMFEINRESRELLAYEASHDKLTGVYNRSGYEFLLDNVDLSCCALLLVDVDSFKAVNDSYGHEVGDLVLVNVARTLRASFRAHDYVTRIGGDEFAVILCNFSRNLGTLIQKKIRRINDQLQHPGHNLPPVSISVGAAFGRSGCTREQLYQQADEALYQVKSSGKAGCAIAPQGRPPVLSAAEK